MLYVEIFFNVFDISESKTNASMFMHNVKTLKIFLALPSVFVYTSSLSSAEISKSKCGQHNVCY